MFLDCFKKCDHCCHIIKAIYYRSMNDFNYIKENYNGYKCEDNSFMCDNCCFEVFKKKKLLIATTNNNITNYFPVEMVHKILSYVCKN